MFCAYCGKNLPSVGGPCPHCGNTSESLRSFKVLDMDGFNAGIGVSEVSAPVQPGPDRCPTEVKTMEKRSPLLLLLLGVCVCAIFTLSGVVFQTLNSKKLQSAAETIHGFVENIQEADQSKSPEIPEEIYQLSGSISDTNSFLLVLAQKTKVVIEEQEYELTEIYLPPYWEKTDSQDQSIEITGKIVKLSNERFMVIETEQTEG